MNLDTLLSPWLWVIFTLVAATGQTFRNALQHELTDVLGTAGATHIRFLFGLPFALLFLVFVVAHFGLPPVPSTVSFGWTAFGAISQIIGTALMLEAMRHRTFVVSTAFLKTEAIQVALFALVFLGETISFWLGTAILIATAGVIILSATKNKDGLAGVGVRPVVLGITAGAMFALSAVGFRGGIQTLQSAHFVLSATTTLAISLAIQTAIVGLWLVCRNPGTISRILSHWRSSVLAGFLGAFASQMWFLAFALETVAKVRTLALIEVLIAGLISRRLFSQKTNNREYVGIGLVIVGVIILLNTR